MKITISNLKASKKNHSSTKYEQL